nr:hypothetical protein [uncultured bacterium]
MCKLGHCQRHADEVQSPPSERYVTLGERVQFNLGPRRFAIPPKDPLPKNTWHSARQPPHFRQCIVHRTAQAPWLPRETNVGTSDALHRPDPPAPCPTDMAWSEQHWWRTHPTRGR